VCFIFKDNISQHSFTHGDVVLYPPVEKSQKDEEEAERHRRATGPDVEDIEDLH